MKYSFLLLLFCSIISFSQNTPPKFGDITMDELKMEKCEFSPESPAMILSDYAYILFSYDPEESFGYTITHTKRIKIFTKDGLDKGTIKLYTYDEQKGSTKEKIGNIKGFVYNLEGGKEKKSKLENSSIFETRLDEYTVETTLSMPDIKEGSVIEFRYSMKSPLLSSIDSWHFQHDIPVGVSKIDYTFPEFYKYQVSQTGNYINVINSMENKQETYSYMSRNNDGKLTPASFISNSTHGVFTASNVMPLEDEPFMTNRQNLPSRLEFQLMSIQWPNQPTKVVAGSYESLNADFIKRDDFGGSLKKGNFIKDHLATIPDKQGVELAASIMHYIRMNVNWNQIYSPVTDQGPNEMLKKGEGSVGDINIYFVAALREAGLDAFPVILRRRNTGIMHPVYPSYKELNYVVAAVYLNNQIYFADAVSNRPFGTLPEHCLNGNGWMVREQGGTWVNLKEGANKSVTSYSKMNIEDESLNLECQMVYSDLSSEATYDSYRKQGEEEFKNSLTSALDNWSLESFTFEETHRETDKTKIQFVASQELEDSDLIYLQPFENDRFSSNPFKREKRISPVDFACKEMYNDVVVVNIPEGYTVELPQTAMVNLPDKAATFIYSASQMGNMITISRKVTINKLEYSPAEYANLRQFFQTLADKTSEAIVLKKL